MSSQRLRDRIAKRAAEINIHPAAFTLDQLVSYLDLLARWNVRMNLTSLAIQEPTDEALDRLIIEPLAAARFIPDGRISWVDIGSGGGSPAIPLKITRPAARLTMVESHARKVAFLREAIRTIGLRECTAENSRFETFATRPEALGTMDFATIRAVKIDHRLMESVRSILRAGGHLLLFRSASSEALPDRDGELELVETARCGVAGRAFELALFARS